MRNWAVDLSRFDKESPEFAIWKLEQLINFGLKGEKLDKERLTKYFYRLRIDPDKRRFIKFILDEIT